MMREEEEEEEGIEEGTDLDPGRGGLQMDAAGDPPQITAAAKALQEVGPWTWMGVVAQQQLKYLSPCSPWMPKCVRKHFLLLLT